jgi:glycerol-3-phosphate acyltransferase PlsY
MFPIWLGFKGGKGVATALGVVAMLAPQSTAITFGVFVVLFVLARMVSLGSIVAALSFAALQMHQLWPRPFASETWSIAAFSLAVPVLIIVRHRANITRLLSGEEHRFEFKQADKKTPS